jgi:hypothetical protein
VVHPRQFVPVLLVQLAYKSLWLIVAVAPALSGGQMSTVPLRIASFFLVWVVVLPWAIPWRLLFA